MNGADAPVKYRNQESAQNREKQNDRSITGKGRIEQNMATLVHIVLDALDGIPSQEAAVFLVSMLPVLELRGGLLAASYLGIDLVRAALICIAGCFLPVPFILLLIRKILWYMKGIRITRTLAEKVEHHAFEKSDQIGKYEFWGLFLFVAAPLPGTGAWTGALVAALLGMKTGRAALAIFLGVLVSAVLMAGIAYGIVGIFFH